MKKSVESGKEIDMKCVRNLLEKLDYELLQGNLDQEISSLVYDSRKVEKDAMFVCVKGAAPIIQQGSPVSICHFAAEITCKILPIHASFTPPYMPRSSV